MFNDFTKHLSHYLSLIGVIIFSLIGLLVFKYDKAFQTAVCLAGGSAYVVWGIVHHHIHDDLHPKIVLEYIAIAALGIVAFLVVIWS